MNVLKLDEPQIKQKTPACNRCEAIFDKTQQDFSAQCANCRTLRKERSLMNVWSVVLAVGLVTAIAMGGRLLSFKLFFTPDEFGTIHTGGRHKKAFTETDLEHIWIIFIIAVIVLFVSATAYRIKLSDFEKLKSSM